MFSPAPSFEIPSADDLWSTVGYGHDIDLDRVASCISLESKPRSTVVEGKREKRERLEGKERRPQD
uniref:Uncharacterized protein n=1 Tax=Pristionchus pacificus TaxID=54126 RepID=A0A2A6C7P6_PRIPA|eukprot:PDM74073.1 hypothetical protein PRIPAC_41429 [Pristionchus pacificus]